MGIKLEVGKRYVNRQGKVWGAVVASADPDDFYKFEMEYEGWVYHFSETGRLFEAEESPCDLIAEAPDEVPVVVGVDLAAGPDQTVHHGADALAYLMQSKPNELDQLRARVATHEGDMGTMRETVRVWRETAKAAETEADALRAENARLREALEQSEPWLSAALDCKEWVWDADQRACAEDALRWCRAALARTGDAQ